MANLNSESYHSLIGFLTAECLGFLKLQVVPRFTGTGTCISPVPVNRNRGILTSLIIEVGTSDDDKTPHYRPKQTSKSTIPERPKKQRKRLDNNISKKMRKN